MVMGYITVHRLITDPLASSAHSPHQQHAGHIPTFFASGVTAAVLAIPVQQPLCGR